MLCVQDVDAVPVANFERDGAMNVLGNQGEYLTWSVFALRIHTSCDTGSRPNYLSTLDPIQLPKRPYVDETHQQWTVRVASSNRAGDG